MRTNGNEKRQLLYIHDLCEALHQIIINFDKFQQTKYIDVSSYDWVKIYDVANIIKKKFKELLDKDIKIIRVDKNDTMQTIMNEPTKSYLNDIWKPKLTLEQGIQVIIERHINHY